MCNTATGRGKRPWQAIRRLHAPRIGFFVPLMFAALLLTALISAACVVPAGSTGTSNAASVLPRAADQPTLADLWQGEAEFVVDVTDTGLPMGESDTVVGARGVLTSYVHAGDQSLGVRDQCGAPVAFPGCLVRFTSHDGGRHFTPRRNAAGVPVCDLPCAACPCDSQRDHIDQQQYPRVDLLERETLPDQWVMVYEYRANTILRTSTDGVTWSPPREVPLTGIWRDWRMSCPPVARVGEHPHTPTAYDCLVGSPPGVLIDTAQTPPELYIFVGIGQNPSHMGCYRGPLGSAAGTLRACDHNPLFGGADDYGPRDTTGPDANAYFDFRTVSSAEVVRVGDRYYMLYEGVRGPQAGDAGDTQFLLGLARSTTTEVDGPWERYAGNPILLDLPGNVGVGHADLVVVDGETYLYTSLDGVRRSRLRLTWR